MVPTWGKAHLADQGLHPVVEGVGVECAWPSGHAAWTSSWGEAEEGGAPMPLRWQAGSTAIRWMTMAGRTVVQGRGSYSGGLAGVDAGHPRQLPVRQGGVQLTPADVPGVEVPGGGSPLPTGGCPGRSCRPPPAPPWPRWRPAPPPGRGRITRSLMVPHSASRVGAHGLVELIGDGPPEEAQGEAVHVLQLGGHRSRRTAGRRRRSPRPG